jgi:hypothetical protein
MKPFNDDQHMIDVHEAMFGEPGRFCAEIVLKWARTLFAVELAPLLVRVLLAPIEMGPYNRHVGYCSSDEAGTYATILMNRHCVKLTRDGMRLFKPQAVEDIVIHELTHLRQKRIVYTGHISQCRGSHRDKGWYQAVSEACPKYLGAQLPETSWPRMKSVRVKEPGRRSRVIKIPYDGTLSEPQLTHWPESLRELIQAGDPRLPAVTSNDEPILIPLLSGARQPEMVVS